MSDTETRREAELIADLNDLLQLDHDAAQAYTVAIDTVRDEGYREALARHRSDHTRHIEELSTLVRARGGLPAEVPHPTGPFKVAVQALGAAGGDVALLLTFKAVEGQVRDKYQRLAARRYPEEVAAVVRRAAEDERRHYEWVESTLTELGVGRGTIPHGLASVVEKVHKAIADPAERIEREIMRRVGEALGTTRQRGGSAAPSPLDVAAAAASTAAAGAAAAGAAAAGTAADVADAAGERSVAERGSAGPSASAARFIEALHDVERSGDVEAMVALFDDEAIISNPLDPSPQYGREGARRFWRSYRDSFEEIRSDFSKVVSTDDTAMLEWTSEGTNAAGERVVYSGVSVVELRDGLVHRFRAYFDSHELQAHPPEPKTV